MTAQNEIERTARHASDSKLPTIYDEYRSASALDVDNQESWSFNDSDRVSEFAPRRFDGSDLGHIRFWENEAIEAFCRLFSTRPASQDEDAPPIFMGEVGANRIVMYERDAIGGDTVAIFSWHGGAVKLWAATKGGDVIDS